MNRKMGVGNPILASNDSIVNLILKGDVVGVQPQINEHISTNGHGFSR